MARWSMLKILKVVTVRSKLLESICMLMKVNATIIGPNGCGVNSNQDNFGIATHYGGVVKHKGDDVSGWRTDQLASRGIAYVPHGQCISFIVS